MPVREPLSWGPAPLREKCTAGPLAPGKGQSVSVLPQRIAGGTHACHPLPELCACTHTASRDSQAALLQWASSPGIKPHLLSLLLTEPRVACSISLGGTCGALPIQSSATVSPCHIPLLLWEMPCSSRSYSPKESRHLQRSGCLQGSQPHAGSGPVLGVTEPTASPGPSDARVRGLHPCPPPPCSANPRLQARGPICNHGCLLGGGPCAATYSEAVLGT